MKEVQKPRRLFQYDELRDFNELECCYYMSWDGYDLSRQVLKQLKKAKQMKNITKFISMDLTCEGSWWDEINDCESKSN